MKWRVGKIHDLAHRRNEAFQTFTFFAKLSLWTVLRTGVVFSVSSVSFQGTLIDVFRSSDLKACLGQGASEGMLQGIASKRGREAALGRGPRPKSVQFWIVHGHGDWVWRRGGQWTSWTLLSFDSFGHWRHLSFVIVIIILEIETLKIIQIHYCDNSRSAVRAEPADLVTNSRVVSRTSESK